METYKTKTKVKEHHTVHIDDVPFEDGQEVEISISLCSKSLNDIGLKNSLKGSVLKYENPFESVITSDDWELLK